jgi:hypothetical protein
MDRVDHLLRRTTTQPRLRRVAELIKSVSTGTPGPLSEVVTLGGTSKKRAVDALGYFYRPGTSNGPTGAIAVL